MVRYDIKIERIMLFVTTSVNREDDRIVVSEPRMVSLGFGKFARSDHIYALEPLLGDERGRPPNQGLGRRHQGSDHAAARTEATILRDMGQEAAATEAPLIDEALDLASRSRRPRRSAESISTILGGGSATSPRIHHSARPTPVIAP